MKNAYTVKNTFAGLAAVALAIVLGALSVTGCSSPTDSPKSTVINMAAIQGVTAPVTGATPVRTITENEQYSGTVNWNGNPSTFAANTQYTATITLTAKDGYTLQGVPANFFTVAGAALASNNADSGVIIAVFPQTGGTADNPTVIDIAAIEGVTAPVTGAVPVTTITENGQYSGTVTWNGNPSVFAASTQYIATITLTAKTGFTLQGVAGNFFTVAEALLTSNNADSGVITAVFPQTGGTAANPTVIDIAAIEGVTAPVTGATPVTSITDNAQYSGTVKWSPNHSTFAANTHYTATITLTAKTGFTMTGVTADSFTVAGATATNAANSGVITAVFPQTGGTAANPTVSVTSVSLNKPSTSLLVNHTETLFAIIEPDNATNRNVTWSSNNTSAATVSAGGVVTAVAVGTATITVTTDDGGKTASCIVTVSNVAVAVTGVSVNKSSVSLVVGATEDLTAAITPANATNQIVTWSSDNTSVAAVSEDGVVTAENVGTATITVTTDDGGKTASCTVTVNPKVITFTVDPISAQTYTGNEITPTVTVKDGSTILTLNTHYTMSYTNNTNAGTGTVTINGMGNYAGSSGSADFTILQTVLPDRIIYYWIDQHDNLVTTSGAITVVTGETLTITAQSTGYIVSQWHLDGVNTGVSGNTYDFSSTIAGKHTIGLFVEKDGELYNTNITITVTPSPPSLSSRTINIDMYDSYGDGWDGNGALRINVNGIDIANNVKVQSGYTNTYTFNVTTGDVVQVYWVTGSGQGENSFIVYYTNAPPSPAFTTSNNNSWNGSNALVYKLQGTMNSISGGTLLGSFTVQ